MCALRFFGYVVSFFFVFLIAVSPIQAYFIYTAGSGGYDISFPQCAPDFPQKPFLFSIIGVNGGKAFTQNECLFNEYHWSKSASAKVSLYMNLNYPSGDTVPFGMDGPAGKCAIQDVICEAYNYGFNAGNYAYTYALSQSVTAVMWWIDIETANTWSDSRLLNNQVLQGALDFFNSEFIQAGVYSTKRDWYGIMGRQFVPLQNLLEPVPEWIVGNPDLPMWLNCMRPFSVNSRVWLVQFDKDAFDGDYACP